jgi:hypothetical protein
MIKEALTTISLLEQIDDFLNATGMSEEQFGLRACGNRKLIPRVRGPRGDFKLTRVNEIMKFLEENKPPPKRKRNKPVADAAE